MIRFTALIAIVAFGSVPALADTYVPGYIKKDGTYVQGHYKSQANRTKVDNYSSKGNTNPYTGARGSVDPYAPKKSTPYQYSAPTYEYKPYSYEPTYKKRGY